MRRASLAAVRADCEPNACAISGSERRAQARLRVATAQFRLGLALALVGPVRLQSQRDLEAEFWPTFWPTAGTWSILREAPGVAPRADRARRRVAGEERSATRVESRSSRLPAPSRFCQERAVSEPAEKLGTPSTPAGTPRSIIRPQLLQPFPFTVRTRIGLCRLLRCRPSRLDLSALDIGLGRFAHATRCRSDVAPAGGLNSRVPLLESIYRTRSQSRTRTSRQPRQGRSAARSGQGCTHACSTTSTATWTTSLSRLGRARARVLVGRSMPCPRTRVRRRLPSLADHRSSRRCPSQASSRAMPAGRAAAPEPRGAAHVPPAQGEVPRGSRGGARVLRDRYRADAARGRTVRRSIALRRADLAASVASGSCRQPTCATRDQPSRASRRQRPSRGSSDRPRPSGAPSPAASPWAPRRPPPTPATAHWRRSAPRRPHPILQSLRRP